MIGEYIKIIFNYINSLKKYRWFHITIFVEFCILLYDIFMLTVLLPSLNDLKAEISLLLLTYIFSSFFAVVINVILLIIILLLSIVFKNINKTKSEFLLRSRIYTPFFFLGIFGMFFFLLGFYVYIKMNQWL